MRREPAVVLIVEDHKDNRAIYRTILEHDGYRVVEAADGETGIAAAHDERPDLILMDISLPGLNGWEATRRLKASRETESIPIVAVTAHAMNGDREKSLSAGCASYVSKPATPQRILEVVRAFIGPPDTRGAA
jgi:two-component system cell cycle response regulator DivK